MASSLLSRVKVALWPTYAPDLEHYLRDMAHRWLRVLTLLPTVGIGVFSVVNGLAAQHAASSVPDNINPIRWSCAAITGLQYVVLRRSRPSALTYVHGYVVSLVITFFVTSLTIFTGGFAAPTYVGINLLMMLASVLVPWRAIHAAGNGALMLAMYFGGNFAANSTAPAVRDFWVLNNLHFMGVTLAICVCACYLRHDLIVQEYNSRQRLHDALQVLQAYERGIREDLAQAFTFQKQLIQVPSSLQGVKVALEFRPTEGIGGDVLDVWERSDGQGVGLLLVDVAGHGVQACMRAMQIRNHHEVLKREGLSPWEHLRELNRVIVETYGSLNIMYTACCLDLVRHGEQTWRLRYSNGGHPPMLVVRQEGSDYVNCAGALQGIDADVEYPEHTETLSYGDRLFVYTDGCAAEALPVDVTPRGCHAVALDVQVQGIMQEVAKVAPAGAQADDMTLLGVELI